MTTVLGSLLIKLGLDSGEFKSGMSQAEKDFKRAQREFEKTGKAMQSLGAKLSIAITAPFIALTDTTDLMWKPPWRSVFWTRFGSSFSAEMPNLKPASCMRSNTAT